MFETAYDMVVRAVREADRLRKELAAAQARIKELEALLKQERE